MILSTLRGVGGCSARRSVVPVRSYNITTKGTPKEHVPAVRGLTPAPPLNLFVFGASMVAFGSMWAAGYSWRKHLEGRIDSKYQEFVANNYEHWRDFENKRVSIQAKILGNGPCGEQYQAAYLCASFPEKEGQQCASSFEAFASCVKDNPILMRWIRPDGKVNWESKLVLHRFLKQKQHYESQIAAIGPADENLDDVLDEYRARYKLGPNATESEVKSFIDDFKSTSSAFYAQVEKLFESESISNTSEVDGLYNKLSSKFSIPADVWLEILKEYDVEEFDENLTYYRRKYGFILNQVKNHSVTEDLLDGSRENVSCGAAFDKVYTCMHGRKDASECADLVDELYFCRQHHTQQVWPYMEYFEKRDKTIDTEWKRLQHLINQFPYVN